MAWQYSKNATAIIIYQNDSKIFRNVGIPQRVAIVKEAQIAGNKGGLFGRRQGKSYGGTRAAIYTTGPSIAIHL